MPTPPRPYDEDWTKFLRLGIDYGTGFLKLSVQYIYPGRSLAEDDIYDVKLEDYSDGGVEIEQVGVWVNTSRSVYDSSDGKLIWGRRNVARWLKSNRGGDKEVLSNWKLALKSDLRSREGVRATVKALGCREDDHSVLASLECVITDHLRQIKSAVLDWCINNHAANLGEDAPDWTNLQLETQIAVPAMWDAVARGVMAAAASDAGLGHVNFREEPQCVAGSAMSWLLSRKFIRADDTVLFFDVGAGTTDEAMVRFRRASTQASRMVLERVGPSHGAQGGSLVVNDQAWEAFKNHVDVRAYGGLAAFCKKLKISKDECQRQVHERIEVIKKDFGPGDGGPYHVAIYGRPTQRVSNAKPESLVFDKHEVERWHDVWASMNENLLVNVLATAPPCRRAVLTGGGMQSRYLRQRLKDMLRSQGITPCEVPDRYPCSRGALNHYWLETDRPLRDATFFATQCEEFNPKFHEASRAEPYKFDKNEKVVHDCLVPIMRVVGHEEVERHCIPMNFDIDSTGPARLHFDVYCTTNANSHKPHGPLKDASGKVFPDLTPYPIAFIDLPNLTSPSFGFRMKEYEGERYYEVLGVVEMRESGGSYELELKLFDSKFRWKRDKNKNIILKHAKDAKRVIYTQTRKIWDPECSAVVKSNVAETYTNGASPADSADSRAVDGSNDHGNVDDVSHEVSQDTTVKLKGKRSRGQLRGLSRKRARH